MVKSVRFSVYRFTNGFIMEWEVEESRMAPRFLTRAMERMELPLTGIGETG